MALNWHRVSSLDTNFKISIFGTHPVTSANVKFKKTTISNICLNMTRTTHILIYLFSKSNCGRYLLLIRKRTIFITINGFVVSHIKRIHICRVFLTKYGFWNNLKIRKIQQFKSKHTIGTIEYHDFVWIWFNWFFGMFL